MTQEYRGPGYAAVFLISFITSGSVCVGLLWFAGILSLPFVGQFKDPPVKEVVQAVVPPQPVRETVIVPKLVGLPTIAAAELLKGRQLRLMVAKERSSLTVPKGSIIEQIPLPDSQLKSDSEVEVIVSSGASETLVPNLIGKTLDEARQACSAQKIEIADVSETGKGKPGTVTKIVPQEGTLIKEGVKISLIVAPNALVMPSLAHMNLKKAKDEIKKLGLQLGRVRWRYSDNVRAYAVISHTPPKGEKVEPNTKVNLVACEDE